MKKNVGNNVRLSPSMVSRSAEAKEVRNPPETEGWKINKVLTLFFQIMLTLELTICPLSAESKKDLILYYNFDKDSGSEVKDLSGNDNNGIIKGEEAEWVDGRFGKALRFNGIDNIAIIKVKNGINAEEDSPAVTMMAWVRPGELDRSNNFLGWAGDGYGFRISRLNMLCVEPFDLNQNKSKLMFGSIKIESKDWYHLAFVYTNDSIKFYVNGKLDTKLNNGTIDPDVNKMNFRMKWNKSPEFYLGYHTSAIESLAPGFAGDIDEVKIFGRALSEEEIKSEIKSELTFPAVPIKEKAPVIDGKIDKDEWEDALVLKGFLKVGNEKLPSEKDTEVRLLTDNRNLYIYVLCEEPDLDNVVAEEQSRDGKVWADDSMEMFIDANRSRATYYQIAVNPNGVIYDAFGSDTSWSPETTKLKTIKQPGYWGFELAIDMMTLGYGKGEVDMADKKMATAFFRNRKLKGAKVETSSWLPWSRRTYASVKDFMPIDIGVKTGGKEYNFRNMDYNIEISLPSQTWQIEKPLYKELFSDKPLLDEKFRCVGTMSMWGLHTGGIGPVAFALQHGFTYDHNEVLDIYKKYNVGAIISALPESGIDAKKESYAYKKYEEFLIHKIMYLNLKTGGEGFEMGPNSLPNNIPRIKDKVYDSHKYFVIDERVVNSLCEWMERLIPRIKDQIAGIQLGHEDLALQLKIYDSVRDAYITQDPQTWEKWDKEVKNKYGGGKFGLPESLDKASALEKIAFYRWFVDRRCETARKIAYTIKKYKPDAIILADNDVAGVFPVSYERMGDVYDILASQMMPSSSQYCQRIGFRYKLMLDLSGKKVWGSVHIENYKSSFSPAEANEILSSAIRVGGDGFQLYLVDWFGITYGDYYGAPDRLLEILNVYEHMLEMNKLKFPEPDTAILYCNIAEHAKGWQLDSSGGKCHETAYTFIGPHAGSWFKFISDYQLADGKVDLAKFKVLYIPSAQYIDDMVVQDKIKKFAEKGGVLVINSPEALRFSPSGEERKDRLDKFFGIISYAKRSAAQKIKVSDTSLLSGIKIDNLTIPLSSLGETFDIELSKDAKIMATFEDGKPAIVVNQYGKGKVITFAADPYKEVYFLTKEWWLFFKALQKWAGAKTDEDIWRFRIPYSRHPLPEIYPKGLTCLTANAGRWIQDKPEDGPNSEVGGEYSYNPVPDILGEKSGKSDKISFKEGDLTDRLKSLRAKPLAAPLKSLGEGKLKELVKGGCIGWDSASTIEINFSFAKKVIVEKISLFTCGAISEVKVFSKDNASTAGIFEGAQDIDYKKVRQIDIDIKNSSQSDKYSIIITKQPNMDFYLSEVEFWGK